MKLNTKIIAGTVVLAGLQLASMTGCVGGYVGVGGPGPGYYGGGPWFDGTVVVGGGGWYGGHGGGAYVHPGGGRR
jgi:hypothetical protein